ncbi:hypothetical protein E8E13_000250 [Curvularia kusanoi]|uniref:Uncharacterized protein n=1 Tax=Curvularia kusanoi TaxID=90978 RepID=A0A9P4W8Q0_CURKU|nr:hypothetical protein E8E13_000250 [Curvularia kusanoi]
MNRMQRDTTGRRQPQPGGPVGSLVRGLAAGIGLASESYQHHKEKKASQAQSQRDDYDEEGNPHTITQTEEGRRLQNDAYLSQQMDEAVWELDEAQDQLVEREDSSAAPTDNELAVLADEFLASNAPPPPYSTTQLTLPVVITQRRPESRTKGFVSAYSPLLNDVGIDQATFLDFIDKLNKSLTPSPWIQAINLAALAGQAVPEPFTIMISIAVKKVADAASNLHSRSKTNSFLDRVNQDFFAPRGLVALIMTWKPNQKETLLTTAEFNMQSSIAKASDSSKSRHWFENSSGATSFEWPQTAPLVFPALDELPSEKQAAIKRSGKFVSEYVDKRARAKWAGQNPDSALANATGKETFSSRYADPNHPASSGDPIALLTGGFIQTGFGRGRGNAGSSSAGLRGRGGALGLGRGRTQDWQRGGDSSHQDGRTKLARGGRGGIGTGGRGQGGIGGSGIGPLTLVAGAKKFFQDDVLYLMIVQRPTEDDMAVATERMASAGEGRY